MKTIIFLISIFLLSSFAVNSQVVLEVSKTTDPDPYIYPYNVVDSLCAPEMYGTIQWATRKANDLGVPCRIVFNIPGTGLRVINLNYQLPIINVPIEIDGTTQPGYTYPNPQVLLKNNASSSVLVGLYIHGSSGSLIKGIAFMKFWYAAIRVTNCTNYELIDNVILENSNFMAKSSVAVLIANSSNGIILGNYIGLTPDGTAYSNVGVGLLLTENSSNNTIGGTATGQGNTFANNYTAIQINAGAGNRISGNRIFNNSFGILLTNNGNLNKAAPIINSFDGTTASGTSAPNDIIEIFGSTGNENANEYLASVTADGNGDWTAVVITADSGVVATATDVSDNTSVFSTFFAILSDWEQNVPVPNFNCHDAGCQLGTNLVINGSFTNAGIPQTPIATPNISTAPFFNSDYKYQACAITSFISRIRITNNAYYCSSNNLFTSTGVLGTNDNFLMADPEEGTGWKKVWERPVSVQPNRLYYFKFYVTNLWFNDGQFLPKIQFQINGTPYIFTYTTPSGTSYTNSIITVPRRYNTPPNYSWIEVCGIWCSGGNSGEISISIFNKKETVTPGNSLGSTHGSDLGIDEISFQEVQQNISVSQSTICPGQSVILDASSNCIGGSPVSYSWSSIPSGFTSSIANPTVNPAVTTTYTVTVTYEDGCSIVGSQTIDVSVPQIYLDVTDETCAGSCNGSALAIVPGWNQPTPWPSNCCNWSWNDPILGPQTSNVNPLTDLCPNITYTFTATNNYGCTNSQSVIIQPGTVYLDISNVNITPTTCGQSNGSISISTTGCGIGIPVNYYWSHSPSVSGPIATGLAAGNYTVTVCCQECCKEIDIVVPCDNLYNIEHTNSSICCDGTITITSSSSITVDVEYPDGTHHSGLYFTGLCFNETYLVAITDNITGFVYTETVFIGQDFTYFNPSPLPPITSSISGIPSAIINGPAAISSGATVTISNCTITWENLFIGNNANVTFSNCNFTFLPNHGIYVGSDVTLTISDCVFDCVCKDMWNGINMTSNSLYFLIVERSSFKNSKNAINIRNCSNLFVDIRDNSIFYNNLYDVIIHYSRISQSIISESQFITSGNLFIPYYYPRNHLWFKNNSSQFDNNAGIVIINACEISNENTYNNSIDNFFRGIGILNESTSLFISNNTNFKKNWYGVLSKVSNSKLFFTKIEQSTFINNNRGIWAEGLTNEVDFRNNGFIVGNNGNQYTWETYPIGLSIKNVKNFEIQDNAFHTGFGGLYMHQNPIQGKMIYRNYFNGLKYAFGASGINDVKLTCNEFGTYLPNINYNIYLINGRILGLQDHAVHYDATNNSINSHNLFEDPISTTDPSHPLYNPLIDLHRFNIVNYPAQNYTYYFGDYTDKTHVSPHPYSSGNPIVNDIQNSPLPIPYLASRCTSITSKNYNIENEIQSINNIKDEVQLQVNTLEYLVDNGNTDYYLNYISNLKPNNFNTLYNKLMQNAPYISDTVLISFMLHPINKPAHKKNVIEACSPLPYRVRPYIDLMNINQNFKNQLWALQNGINSRVSVENSITNGKYHICFKLNRLFLAAIDDSTTEKLDSILDYILISGNIDERMMASPYYIGIDRITDANQNLIEIEAINVNLEPEITEKTDNFIRIQRFSTQMAQLPDSLSKNMIQLNESWLSELANDSTQFCQSDAMAYLELLYDTLFPRKVYLDSVPSLKSIKFINDIYEKSSDCDKVTVKPNPAKDYVQVHFSEYLSNGFLISIYDNQGRFVESFSINDEMTFINIDLKSRTPGVYYLILLDKAGILCSKKLIVE